MIRNYFLITLKVLARRKFFTFVSLFGISFTLMILSVATALFTHSFSPRMPESRFDRVLYTQVGRMTNPEMNMTIQSPLGYPFVHQYALPLAEALPEAIEAIALFTDRRQANTFLHNRKVNYQVRHVSAAYFKVVDLQFLEGAPFGEADDLSGNLLAVISKRLRQQYFGEKEEALGKTLLHDGRQFTVVGVVDNVPEIRKVAYSDLWLPIGADRSASFKLFAETNSDYFGGFQLAILARSTAHLSQIKQAMQEVCARVEFPKPEELSIFQLMPRTHFEHFAAVYASQGEWKNYHQQEFTGIVYAYLGLGLFFFFLLPSLNLVNLNLSRMMERASEIGVRRAFGAPTLSLMGQFILENVFISLIGGVLGLLLSIGVLHWLNQAQVYVNANFQLNIPVFLVGMFAAVLFGLLSGVYPAWRMSRLHPVAALNGQRI
jgi:putative ABC transport system permease protein